MAASQLDTATSGPVVPNITLGEFVTATLLGFGFLLAILVFRKLQDRSYENWALFFLTPILYSILLVLHTAARNAFGLPVFVNEFLLGNAILFLPFLWFYFCLFQQVFSIRRSQLVNISWHQSHLPILAFFLLVLFNAFQVVLMPAQGWDTLDYYARWGVFLIEFDSLRTADQQTVLAYMNSFSAVAADFTDFGTALRWEHPRHPATPIVLAALSTYLAERSTLGLPPFALHVAMFLSLASCVALTLKVVGVRSQAIVLLMLVLCGTPLLEAHILNLGYADFLNFIIVGVASVSIVLFIRTKNPMMLALSCLFAVSTLQIKNVSILYFIPLAMTIFYAVVNSSLKSHHEFHKKALSRSAHITLFFAGFALLLVIAVDLSISEGAVRFGGLEMEFQVTAVGDLAANISRALFVNASYSVLPIACFILILKFALADRLNNNFEDQLERSSLWLLVFTMALFSLMPNLVASYASAYAAPGSDVGQSRIMLPLIVPAILLAGVSVKEAQSVAEQRD